MSEISEQEAREFAGLDDDPERLKVNALIEKAMQHVFDLCSGKERWTMRVPVDELRDSDIVIMSALTAAKKYINERNP